MDNPDSAFDIFVERGADLRGSSSGFGSRNLATCNLGTLRDFVGVFNLQALNRRDNL